MTDPNLEARLVAIEAQLAFVTADLVRGAECWRHLQRTVEALEDQLAELGFEPKETQER